MTTTDILHARLADVGLSDRATAILALARSRIAIQTTSCAQDEVPIGASRFGGVPDFPAEMAWPVHLEHKDTLVQKLAIGLEEYPVGTFAVREDDQVVTPLAFVAQLRLADLAPYDVERLLPETGTLWFFVRPEVQVDDDDEGDLPKYLSRVLYSPLSHGDQGFERAQFPDELPEHHRYAPCIPSYAQELALPPYQGDAFKALDLPADQSEVYYDPYSQGIGAPPNHQLLGHAQANYYRGLPAPGDELLLQVGSDEAMGCEWNDASSIFFCIPRAALAARNFKQAFCLPDE